MAVYTNFNDNCAHNVEMRKERVIWVGATIHPGPKDDGIFFVKLITPSGEIIKSTSRHEGMKWQLGSGELAGIKVFEWMDDRKK